MSKQKGLLSFLKLDGITNSLSSYINDRLELYKLEAKDELATILSKFIVLSFSYLALFVFLIFGSLAISALLNDLLHSTYAGYAIIALFYLILFAIAMLLRRNTKLMEGIKKHILSIIHHKN
ncbi:MAG: phage holin family protein [Bacteroidota bacterium]